MGCLPSRCAVRLVLCRTRKATASAVNQTFAEVAREQMVHLMVMKVLAWRTRFRFWSSGLSRVSAEGWLWSAGRGSCLWPLLSLVPRWMCCRGEVSGNLESLQKSLAGKESVSIFAGCPAPAVTLVKAGKHLNEPWLRDSLD